ncbi:MAG: response regulator [Parachlamydiaceae bacterium]|nr:response regulator [Parachlamydiaceae bacterium]
MALPKPNILYVDDEPNNLLAFSATFRRYFNIFTAESGKQGIDILRQHPIELIITDQRMPEMTGVQFLEAIMPDFPDAMRLILTGYTDVEAIIKAINTGRVYRYITKPWNEEDLKTIIDSALKTYRLERENKELISKLNEEIIKSKQTMNLFKKYVPELVLNEILSNYNETSITHGEHRIVTVLFTDIRNFTAIVATLDPRQIVSLLNDYFSIMSECVNAHKGSVNKYIGDGLLAVFGAPLSYIDNHYNAVACSLEMMHKLDSFNAKWGEIVGRKISLGIGINTGEVVAGNIGSADHIEYSVIGNTVNIASRIEALTKEIPNAILISESTYLAVKDKITVEKLAPVEIKGQEGKLQVYRVIDRII